jgi:hypothetical protein
MCSTSHVRRTLRYQIYRIYFNIFRENSVMQHIIRPSVFPFKISKEIKGQRMTNNVEFFPFALVGRSAVVDVHLVWPRNKRGGKFDISIAWIGLLVCTTKSEASFFYHYLGVCFESLIESVTGNKLIRLETWTRYRSSVSIRGTSLWGSLWWQPKLVDVNWVKHLKGKEIKLNYYCIR